ncbi:MAG: cysteine desulfurase [Alphaproteobacteria bacterium]|nr:cysteine desulfurase [Alphaproteobacteria bacterium]
MYDIENIRNDFHALSLKTHNKPLVYLDTAASAQKPNSVIEKIKYIYENEYANVHRGMYELSEKATLNFEEARSKVRLFINAKKNEEIIFTKGATNSINTVAYSWGLNNLSKNDEIIICESEHHSNIVPWQLIQRLKGFTIKVAKVDDNGCLDLDYFKSLLNDKVKLVCQAHVSNVLGTIFPIKEVCELSHKAGALVMVDGCQAIPHTKVDVQDLDCDFYAFSGHKLYGPTGVGVLYGKKEILENMVPFEGGGDMIKTVAFEGSSWADLPARFEAGTPMIVQAIGLGYAIDYVNSLGMDNITKHEKELSDLLALELNKIDGIINIGTAPNKAGVFSFVSKYAHPQDYAMVLDQQGIAVRTGHHCAQPLHKRFNQSVSVRASLGLYTNQEDIERFIAAIKKANQFFA